ncbi:hypothetical protein C8A00DRAFT_12482 [Chaetomidium leptoderma]|uniref:F-box domain-containing protein n=1 Tax=Chaetomidium leptoderma TaxID=669021 RepID=A0AAN6VRN7_9PEZI|nr:hypothetical protein C8A00DRAFT_12482 [Chaetomidium leptoderma]
MQAEQQENQRPPKNNEMDSEGTDLDSAVAVQLIVRSKRHPISGPGSAALESWVSVSSSDTLTPSPEGTACSSSQHTQPYVATTEGWREDTSAPTSTAPGVFTPGLCSSMAATRSQMLTQDGEPSVAGMVRQRKPQTQLLDLPNEVLFYILGFLEVCDLLATSRTSHHLRTLSLTPYIHKTRLRRTRALLPPLLTSPSRPSRPDLVRRCIVLTHTAFASRKLAHNLASIRLARQLAARPSAETLVERCVLPRECLPGGGGGVASALVARKRAVEKERVKDRLRGWVGSVWKGEVGRREEGVRLREERAGVGRVWRLRRFWEGVGRGEVTTAGEGGGI